MSQQAGHDDETAATYLEGIAESIRRLRLLREQGVDVDYAELHRVVRSFVIKAEVSQMSGAMAKDTVAEKILLLLASEAPAEVWRAVLTVMTEAGRQRIVLPQNVTGTHVPDVFKSAFEKE